MPTFKLEDITVTSDSEDMPALMGMAYDDLYNRMFPVNPDEPAPELSAKDQRQVDLARFEQFKERLASEPSRVQGILRTLHIPAVPGQQATYADKEKQAELFLNDPDPDPLYYPALFGSEAQARELTPAQMAQLILTRAQTWKDKNAKIEGAAFIAKRAVPQTRTVKELVDALIEQWNASQ